MKQCTCGSHTGYPCPIHGDPLRQMSGDVASD